MNENEIKLLVLGGLSIAVIYYIVNNNKVSEMQKMTEVPKVVEPTKQSSILDGFFSSLGSNRGLQDKLNKINVPNSTESQNGEIPQPNEITNAPTKMIDDPGKPYGKEDPTKSTEPLPITPTEIPTVNSKSSRYGYAAGAIGLGSVAVLGGIVAANKYNKYRKSGQYNEIM